MKNEEIGFNINYLLVISISKSLVNCGIQIVGELTRIAKLRRNSSEMTLLMKHPIHVGIHAIGMIDRTIYCDEYKEGTGTLFRNFRIWTR
ncbi:hypothetical protein FJZ33_04970 [Candidatus Poribacteria bacterium]|nr:hypothetical protein [Candidatus Poribacteria bacterium]